MIKILTLCTENTIIQRGSGTKLGVLMRSIFPPFPELRNHILRSCGTKLHFSPVRNSASHLPVAPMAK